MNGREKFDSTNVSDVHSLNLPVGPISQSIGCLGKWVSEQNSGADTDLSVSPTRKTQLSRLIRPVTRSLTHFAGQSSQPALWADV